MRKFKLAAGVLAVMALAACGGGGGGTAAPAVSTTLPSGVYTGTITGSATSSAFQLLALDGGEYYSMYGVNTGPVFGVVGFVEGTGAATGNTFTSSDLRDFGLSPAGSGTLTSTFSDTNISGTISGGISFNGTRPASSTYDYNAAANLTAIVGAWNLTTPAGTAATINIAAAGTFSGASNGCTYTGTLTPRASGKNVFDLALTFGGAPCAQPNTSATGIALSYPLTNGQRQLILAGKNSSRTLGTALFGTR